MNNRTGSMIALSTIVAPRRWAERLDGIFGVRILCMTEVSLAELAIFRMFEQVGFGGQSRPVHDRAKRIGDFDGNMNDAIPIDVRR